MSPGSVQHACCFPAHGEGCFVKDRPATVCSEEVHCTYCVSFVLLLHYDKDTIACVKWISVLFLESVYYLCANMIFSLGLF